LLTTTGGILILSNIKSNPNNDMDESGAYQALIGGFITIGVVKLGFQFHYLFLLKKK
jgi:hypothetical protein